MAGFDSYTEKYFKEVLGLESKEIKNLEENSEGASTEEIDAMALDAALKKKKWREGDDNNKYTDTNSDVDPMYSGNAIDNYGYINKPTGAGFANALPGALGVGGRILNGMVNASNTGAENEARRMLGIEPKSMIKGTFKDDQGYLGDISYNGATSPVGFEAQTPDGQITLTPNEARMRQQMSGAKPATEKESKRNKDSFEKNEPQARGLIARAFGTKPKETAPNTVRQTPDYTPPSRVEPSITPAAPMGASGFQRLPNAYNDPDLPARDMAGMSIENKRAGRSELPTSDILSQVQDVVTDTIGPEATVHLRSGMEPEGKSPVGTKYRHPLGMAGDFQVTDKDGNPITIDSQQMKDIATNAAGRYGINFGAGKGYMGDKTVHMDNMDLNKYPGAPQWGATGKAYASDLNLARAEGVMAPSYYDVDAPTPTARPDPNSPAVAEVASSYPRATGFADVGRTMSFDPNTRETMARTLAGEIDPSKTDLSSPTGVAEANGIMSTMENRAPRYGSVESAITAPNAYSTWGTEQAAKTANSNYDANPQRYNSLVDSYTTDVTANTGFTNYHNPSISNPGWSTKMENVQDIGPHKFGSLPEFGQNFGQTNISKTTQSQLSTPSRAGTGVQAMGQVSLQTPAQAEASKSQGFNGMKTDSVTKGPAERSKTPNSTGSENRGGGTTSSSSSTGSKSSTGPSQSKSSSGPKSSSPSGSKSEGGRSGGGGW